MIISLQALLAGYGLNPVLATALATLLVLALVGGVSWISFYVARRYVLRLVRYLLSHLRAHWSHSLLQHKVFQPLAYLAPLLLTHYLAPLTASQQLGFSQPLADLLVSFSSIGMLLVTTMALNNFLNAFADICRQFTIARHRPIKSYIQVAKIFLYGISAIFIIATMLNQSPLTLLTGLGALTAIFLLIFKDSILGFVASVQIATYDMVRINDWIEIPKYGVDGDVLDISLNTIKVQNFDKTIVTIPTHAILNEGVKNWRGMQESGGRRIKRSIDIDMHSIKFCNQDMLQRFSRIAHIADYLDAKITEIKAHNAQVKSDLSMLANGRHLTNIGVFRAYLEAYLRSHPKVHQQLTFLVRQLKPTAKGLPIEIYIFTNDTNWTRYEAIQADIFDHILAIIPEFDLKVFQDISSEASLAYQASLSTQPDVAALPAN